MKRLPLHRKKFNRQIEHSAHREEGEEKVFDEAFRKSPSIQAAKKKKKQVQRQEKWNRICLPKDSEEKNLLHKHRTPQTRDRPHNPSPADKKHTPPSRF